MVPMLKMRCFSCLLWLLLPPEMSEIAQTFISETEWLAELKCHATDLSTSLFHTERRCSANLSDRQRPVSPISSSEHLMQEMQEMQEMMLEEVHVKLCRIT